MPIISLIVNHKVGLHLVPASLFVKTASGFKSDIKVVNNEKTANAKSILSILTLGVYQGTKIQVQAEGEDANEALEAIRNLVESNFGEPE